MFVDYIKQALIRTISSVKNLSFPVKNKFLKIKCHSFCDAEILCILRNTDLKFFACTEKMVDRIPTGKNHPGIVLDLYFLLAEFFSRDSFEADKRMEIELKAVFS